MFCPKCGKHVEGVAKFCRECGTQVATSTAPQTAGTAQPNGLDARTKAQFLVQARKKSGWLAAFLNLVLPGAGYAYCGRWFLGIVAFLFCVALFVMSFGLAVPGLAVILFIDGFLAAGRHNRKVVEDVIVSSASQTDVRVQHLTEAPPSRVAPPALARTDAQGQAGGNRQERECPHCAEKILVRANRCRFCNQDVPPIEIPNSPLVPHKPSADDAASLRSEAPQPPRRLGWSLAFIGLAVVVVGVVGYFIVASPRHAVSAQVPNGQATENQQTAPRSEPVKNIPPTQTQEAAPSATEARAASLEPAADGDKDETDYVVAQALSSPWAVAEGSENNPRRQLGNQKVLVATTQARPTPDSPFLYQLQLTCRTEVGPRLSIDLSTYAAGVPREIPWTDRDRGHGGSPRLTFRYRIDDDNVNTNTLDESYWNGGEDFQSEVDRLPQRRLLIADVFPNETVEFLFSSLTAIQRSMMQTMCFPPQSK